VLRNRAALAKKFPACIVENAITPRKLFAAWCYHANRIAFGNIIAFMAARTIVTGMCRHNHHQ